MPLPDHAGWVPLEQVIAGNLSALFPRASESACFFFRVTRGAKDDPWQDQATDQDVDLSPGAIIGMVTAELTARKYAGVVRLEVSADMPAELRGWLATQLDADPADVIATDGLLSLGDLMELPVEGHAAQRDPPHQPVTHPRLRNLDPADPSAIFGEIRRGDILVHLPYHSFDTSILRFLQSAAADPAVLAVKLTIYRTGRRSPIIGALKQAARRGKQVAVLVEITARFDEAPNISWGKELEQAGAHVAYGVERVKTHVKLALVVRQEPDGIRRYVHVGTGNYHEGTARLYEDLGLLSADSELAAHAAAVFNELTGGIPALAPGKLLVAPHDLRERFTALIRREAGHARAGRPCGIRAKMNQLQDPQMIRELYQASLAGVPIVLNVRGLCCLRAGVPGLSPTIRVYSTLGRFLEHSRIYRFENGWRARVLHRLGRLDDAQPLPADGGCRPRLRSGHQGRAGDHPAHLRAGQLRGVGHAARRRVHPPPPGRGRGPAGSPAGVHRTLHVDVILEWGPTPPVSSGRGVVRHTRSSDRSTVAPSRVRLTLRVSPDSRTSRSRVTGSSRRRLSPCPAPAATGAAGDRWPGQPHPPTPSPRGRPGETTPPRSMSVAATPPIGKPYPQCTSGIAYDATTMPGSSATLTTCSSARSAAGSGISARLANTTPGTRIRPCRGMTNRYSDSAMISTGGSLLTRRFPAPASAYGVRGGFLTGSGRCSATVPDVG